jgi:hypothetical protein
MPIRFRCAYCNQLMAIAHRKAGTVVRCPTCAGQVVVPNAEQAAPPAAPTPRPAPSKKPEPARGPALFEHSNFDEVFQSPAAPPPPAPPLVLGAQPPVPEPAFSIEPMPLQGNIIQNPLKRPTGVVLSPAKIVLFALVVLVLVALAFFIGLLIGQGREARESELGQAQIRFPSWQAQAGAIHFLGRSDDTAAALPLP